MLPLRVKLIYFQAFAISISVNSALSLLTKFQKYLPDTCTVYLATCDGTAVNVTPSVVYPPLKILAILLSIFTTSPTSRSIYCPRFNVTLVLLTAYSSELLLTHLAPNSKECGMIFPVMLGN